MTKVTFRLRQLLNKKKTVQILAKKSGNDAKRQLRTEELLPGRNVCMCMVSIPGNVNRLRNRVLRKMNERVRTRPSGTEHTQIPAVRSLN